MSPEQAQATLDNADRLYSSAELEAALDRLAGDIQDRLGDSDPVLLCVMNGGLVPVGQLVTRLRFPLQIDYVHATRYQRGLRGGEVQWIAPPTLPIKGRCVLVIDDIYDEGLTLAAIMDFCRAQGAREVLSAVMFEKRHNRKAGNVQVDFIGLEVEDRYVFGFGMDYHEYFRNLPEVYAVRE